MSRRCCKQVLPSVRRDPFLRELSSSASSSPTSSSSSAADAVRIIDAVPREVSGARASARQRRQGRIPSVVLSRGEDVANGIRPVARKLLLSTERQQIKSILRIVKPDFFCNTPFQLLVRAGAGSSCILESGRVLPIKLHKDPETGEILNLVFQWLDDKSEVPVNIPIVFKGESYSPGLRKGGTLNKIISSVKFQCPVDDIPPKIAVDVSKLDIGEKITLQNVKVNPSWKLLSKIDSTPICKIVTAQSPDQISEVAGKA